MLCVLGSRATYGVGYGDWLLRTGRPAVERGRRDTLYVGLEVGVDALYGIAFELCDATLDPRDLQVSGDAAPAERARHRELPVEVGQLPPGGFELRIGRRGHRLPLYVAGFVRPPRG